MLQLVIGTVTVNMKIVMGIDCSYVYPIVGV